MGKNKFNKRKKKKKVDDSLSAMNMNNSSLKVEKMNSPKCNRHKDFYYI